MESNASGKSDLQSEFFNTARKDRTLLAVFLCNGKKLVGRIRSFDKFTILLEGQQGSQIVYKHAISTVGPYHSSRTNAGPAPDRGPRPGDGPNES